jgi:YesN/AraC family two-component response regulator
MLKLVCQHQDKKTEVKLSGQWVDMDPREWRNQFDVSINVGLGVGNKDQQIQHLMMLRQDQARSMALGITGPEEMYNSALELTKNMGFKSGDKFYKKPDPNQPPPNPQAAEMQMKQMELQAHGQIEQAKMQSQAQIEQLKAQFQQQTDAANRQHEAELEQMRAQMQAQVDMNRDRSQSEQETLKMQQAAQLQQLEAQYKDAAHQREQEMTWQIAQLNAAAKIEVANIMSQAKIRDAATDAATATVAADE